MSSRIHEAAKSHRTSTKKRYSLLVTQPQDAYLRVEARTLGISVADLIRRILDNHRLNQAHDKGSDS